MFGAFLRTFNKHDIVDNMKTFPKNPKRKANNHVTPASIRKSLPRPWAGECGGEDIGYVFVFL